jgi:MraZ protein
VALFLSRYDNKVDKKGRVSVPAPYRAALASQNFAGIVAYPSPVSDAIECCGMDRMEKLAAGIETFNPFSDQFGAFATAILSRAHQLAFDGEGRVLLPETLLGHAGIDGMATFAGRGPVFQIWQPEAYAAYERDAAAQAREQAAQLALAQQGAEGGA